ncbi:translocation/assembly module TamB domain-containing protein [Trinickia fusca]|uniref:Translocation and assembly module TamB C-terminal domain-containing protein n=1 Tax=Trinickia fusca TaxID=2419777 RepID=A0A494X9I3_9BURK|nr:translocation/assembly module TamB domain-containing protein [Trinickia fusca]RKP44854.1 hypothetical protein D7S89_21095 [Trinickia fusca]
MTNDSPPPPHDDDRADAARDADEPAKPPVRRRGGRGWRVLAWSIADVAVVIVLVLAALYGALTTERGTQLAWRTAVAVTGGRLSGTLAGGTLATGVRLKDVRWHEAATPGAGAVAATDIRIDSIDGRWALTRSPWRLTVDELRIGTLDARVAPSTNPAPIRLPASLQLPLQIEVRALVVDKIVWRSGTTATEFDRLRLRGHSDGRRHAIWLDGIETPYGAVVAQVALDGAQPFALTGDAGLAGTLHNEPAQLNAHVSGTLETLVAEIDASGMKLAGHARIEATPFAAIPFKRASLVFAHVNPQAFSAGSPEADLSVNAELAPVPGAGALVVEGPVSIRNARPGRLGDHLLPLIDAHADLQLDAHAQRFANLRARLVKDATLTGAGTLTGGHGRIDMRAAGLDLSVFTPTLRPTALAGPIRVALEPDAKSIELDLADPHAALRARAQVAFEPKRIALHDVRVEAGAGRIALKGVFEHDARGSYDLTAELNAFDPRLVLAQALPAPARQTSTNGTQPDKGKVKTSAAAPAPEARVTGTLQVTGALVPTFATTLRFALRDSVYDGLPLTGKGTVQMAGKRLLPSDAALSIAGNDVALQGSFGAAGDRLRFHVDAPRLERLGFGLSGAVKADGDLTGSLAHPDVALTYDARGVTFGTQRIGSAVGHAQVRDGARGALEFTTDARDVHTGVVELTTLTAHLTGTRAQHALDAHATGTVRGHPIDVMVAATGGVLDTRDGPRWDGHVTRLANRGMPALALEAPVTLNVARESLTLGAARLSLEGALIDVKSLVYDQGAVRSAGSATNLSLGRLLAIRQELTGLPSRMASDLVLAADWDFTFGRTASGYARLERRSGDVSVDTGRGLAALGITAIAARAEFSASRRLDASVRAQASRIGTLDAHASVPLEPDSARGGLLGLAADAPLSGTVSARVPALKTTGGLYGPGYVLDGHLALDLALAGTLATPTVSGSLTGDDLAATLVDQGLQVKNGQVRIALTENLVDFQHVEFHGGDGTLRATGRIRLDRAEPDLTAQIVADKLSLFAAPDRQLTLSGSATVSNGGPAGGIDIGGKFTIDHARFDMPEQAAPHLSDDVVVVRETRVERGAPQPLEPTNKPAGRFAPHADIDIDLGRDFRFRGQGADLGLRGTVTALSAPNQPLRATGNVRVTEGSTYTTFGRKLSIENGFFTFNGPVANPGINILAMRRNQEVEAGVQVTGTVRAPVVKLVSEPNVADNEKLSWLLFGHGTDQGNNLGQQSSMTTALALLGSATGKRVAQTVGLDEFSVGRSEVGLTDSQVVMMSKAINERLVLGYEQGLQSASNAFKATVNLSRFWAVAFYGGTFQGFDVNFTRRFDRLGATREAR